MSKNTYNPTRIKRPEAELQGLLSAHLKALANHCQHYDSGDKFYASEIAGNLRTLLFHNPPSNAHSLIHQIGLQDKGFFDTERIMAGGNPKVITDPAGGLVYSRVVKGEGKLVQHWDPHLYIHESFPLLIYTPYSSWWEANILTSATHDRFSRKRIIRQMATEDRGSHVAPGIEKAYFELTRNDATLPQMEQMIEGDAVSEPSQLIDPARIHPVITEGCGMKIAQSLVRQIAHEVLLSFEGHNESYLKLLPPVQSSLRPVMWINIHLRDAPKR